MTDWAEDSYDRTPDRTPVTAAEETPPEDGMNEQVGELKVSEYLIFLFALDTYMRYLEEVRKVRVNEDFAPEDKILKQGLALLRRADREHLAIVEHEIAASVTAPNSLSMLKAAIALSPTPKGAALRALKLRTVLSRGGTATSKAIFGKSRKALKEVRDAMDAAMLDDSDAALAKLAMIDIRNTKLEQWIDLASEMAKPLDPTAPTAEAPAEIPVKPNPINPIQAAARSSIDSTQDLVQASLIREGTPASSEGSKTQAAKQEVVLRDIERNAQVAAAKGLAKSGQEDAPVKRSEVIAIATTAIAAQKAEAAPAQEVPPSLRGSLVANDPQQLRVVLKNGRTLVAAGAGAGKSATLIAKMKYLIQDKNVSPGNILAVTFNKVAAESLRSRAREEMGQEVAKGIVIGTMHSIFKNFITTSKYSTPEEKSMFSPRAQIAVGGAGGGAKEEYVTDDKPRDDTISGKAPTAGTVSYAVSNIMKQCGPAGLAKMTGYPEKLFENRDIPTKSCGMHMTIWRGNNVSAKTAKAGAETIDELHGAIFYEIYQGLKGDLGPGWAPPCGPNVPAFVKFRDKYRRGGEHLGDFTDMIRVFHDILKRSPEARADAQQLFDHIMVDEAQDLNELQQAIFRMLGAGYEGREDKSISMIGDDKQSINQFTGSRPELFTGLKDVEGCDMLLMDTNYRSEPEIVGVGNRIASGNPGQIPMVCRASPGKKTGNASIVVDAPPDYVEGAAQVFDDFEHNMALTGEDPDEYAVLSRTNRELDAFEDQCILREIPYVRSRKSPGFLSSRETTCVLGYMDLALSSDYLAMQDALVNIINKPDRGLFMGQEDIERYTKQALKSAASNEGMDYRALNPLDILTSGSKARRFAEVLLESKRNLKPQAWMWDKDVEELTDKLLDLGKQITKLRMAVRAGAKTTQVLDSILDGITSTVGFYNKKTRVDSRKTISLREQIKSDLAMTADPEEDVDEDAEPIKRQLTVDSEGRTVYEDVEGGSVAVDPLSGLGTVRYLYQLAVPNEKDKAKGRDPENGRGFFTKMEDYKTISKELQDPSKNAKRMTLSTVHSVKGAQWKHVALLMTDGIFPIRRKNKNKLIANELDKLGLPMPEIHGHDAAAALLESIKEDPMIAERNLAYVGVTRAKTDLRILCSQERVPPQQRKNGPVLGQFVKEAQLHLGQNVEVASGTSAESLPLPTGDVPMEAIPEEGLEDYDMSGDTGEDFDLRLASEYSYGR